jgi:hypothetical protein
MLVIKVELWPGGDPGKAELVGGATVVNELLRQAFAKLGEPNGV